MSRQTTRTGKLAGSAVGAPSPPERGSAPTCDRVRVRVSKIGKFCKFLAGSFSAVSKRIFAREYAFDSIFQALQICIPLHRCNLKNFAKNRFEKSAIFVKISANILQMLQNLQNLPNKPLSGPRRRAPRPERGAWRWLCTAWVHSRKPCKRRTANRNEQKFTEQKRTCAI